MLLLYSQIPFNEGKEAVALKEFFKVLKDHKNPLIQELVNLSYEDLLNLQQCDTENVTTTMKKVEYAVSW